MGAFSRMILFPLLLAAPQGAAALEVRAESTSALHKVIGMLQDMSAKAKQEKNDEEVAFAKFETWCSQESADLKGDIEKGAEQIEDLGASIDKLASDVKRLGEEIAEHQASKTKHEADLKAEVSRREKDHAAFLAEEKDYSESVDALERALAILNKEDYDREGTAAALLQVTTAARMPEKAKSIVAAFMSMMDDKDGKDEEGATSPLGGTDYAAPEASAYEFQSGGVIDMLKKLQDDFRKQLGTCQKEEMNAQHAFAMAEQDHKDSIENHDRAAREKSVEKERKTAKKGEDTKQKKASEKVQAENEKTLSEMTTECEEKKASFSEKQQLRAEEIEAIGKAVEILSSKDVSGAAEKHLSLPQVKSPVARSLLQVATAEEARALGVHRRIRDFLTREGQRLHSQNIALLAEKMMADPFAKVKQMIDAMITRLLEEANQDAQHEGFCDTEMGKNKVTRTKLQEDIDGLSAAIESGKANIVELSEDTEELTKEVAALEKAMGEAAELRGEEKAKNKATIEDAAVAQKAVEAATAVLKDFYEKAATATAFLQAPHAYGVDGRIKMGTDEWKSLANPSYEPSAAAGGSGKATDGVQGSVDTGHKEGMQTFGETEQGQQDAARYGVLGLLEIILSDFANLQADTKASEAAAADSFDSFMVESKQNKAVKEEKIELNTADRAAAEAKLQQDTADLKATQDELLAADRVYEKLVPQCIDQGMTWEERVAAQKAEIGSLKEALKILDQPNIA